MPYRHYLMVTVFAAPLFALTCMFFTFTGAGTLASLLSITWIVFGGSSAAAYLWVKGIESRLARLESKQAAEKAHA
jgi:hypothetical protein